jgi:hypothetical protein
MVWNPKSEGPVSPKIATAPGQQRKQWVPKDVSSVVGLEGSHGQIGPRSKALAATNEVKSDAQKTLEEVAAEQIKAQGKKTKASAEAGTSSQQPPN